MLTPGSLSKVAVSKAAAANEKGLKEKVLDATTAFLNDTTSAARLSDLDNVLTESYALRRNKYVAMKTDSEPRGQSFFQEYKAFQSNEMVGQPVYSEQLRYKMLHGNVYTIQR